MVVILSEVEKNIYDRITSLSTRGILSFIFQIGRASGESLEKEEFCRIIRKLENKKFISVGSKQKVAIEINDLIDCESLLQLHAWSRADATDFKKKK